MSNRIKIKIKKPKVHRIHYQPPRMYTSFNIFTRYGENQLVKSNKPMTIEEAQYHFHALSISGND